MEPGQSFPLTVYCSIKDNAYNACARMLLDRQRLQLIQHSSRIPVLKPTRETCLCIYLRLLQSLIPEALLLLVQPLHSTFRHMQTFLQGATCCAAQETSPQSINGCSCIWSRCSNQGAYAQQDPRYDILLQKTCKLAVQKVDPSHASHPMAE